MIKYARANTNRVLLEFTSNKLNKKNVFIMKKRKSLFKRKKPIMSNIIHKSKSLIAKLNIFDYLVVFLLFFILVFFVYNRFQRQSTWVNVRLAIENVDWWYGSGVPPKHWYANQLEVGDEVRDSFGKKIAEVINIDNYDQGGPYRMIFVDLKMSVDYDKNRDQYLYEFKPLTTGSPLILNFPKNQLRGLIIQIGEKETEYFFKTIKVSKKKSEKSLADQIKVGDKAYDTEGDLVAEILDFKNSVNSFHEYSDIRAQMVQVYDPDYRDLELTLKVKAFNNLDLDFYINNAVLKVGSKIWFEFKDYVIANAEIIEVFD
jgi:hypothetical protein